MACVRLLPETGRPRVLLSARVTREGEGFAPQLAPPEQENEVSAAFVVPATQAERSPGSGVGGALIWLSEGRGVAWPLLLSEAGPQRPQEAACSSPPGGGAWGRSCRSPPQSHVCVSFADRDRVGIVTHKCIVIRWFFK